MAPTMWLVLIPSALLMLVCLVQADPTYDFHAIYPGTKYCGTGNVSKNYDDLGYLRELDMCCREHDSCTGFIEQGQEKGGLKNNGLIPIFPCRCDDEFRRCLHEVKSSKFNADIVGSVYFDMGSKGCFADSEDGSGKLEFIKSTHFKPCIVVDGYKLCQ